MHKDKIKYIAMSDEKQNPYQQLEALPPDSLFIFRHYQTKERAALAFDLSLKAKKQKQLFMLAGDSRLAFKLGNLCHGLHLPEWQLKRNHLSLIKRPSWLISAAAHQWPALRLAARLKIDFALLSPVFVRHNQRKPLGCCRFAFLTLLSHRLSLPVYALGGMNKAQNLRLRATASKGFASVSAFNPFTLSPNYD